METFFFFYNIYFLREKGTCDMICNMIYIYTPTYIYINLRHFVNFYIDPDELHFRVSSIIYIHTHTHTYIHACINVCSSSSVPLLINVLINK